jgi:hypothetical protein
VDVFDEIASWPLLGKKAASLDDATVNVHSGPEILELSLPHAGCFPRFCFVTEAPTGVIFG